MRDKAQVTYADVSGAEEANEELMKTQPVEDATSSYEVGTCWICGDTASNVDPSAKFVKPLCSYHYSTEVLSNPKFPVTKEADPELEKLLAEEEKVEAETKMDNLKAAADAFDAKYMKFEDLGIGNEPKQAKLKEKCTLCPKPAVAEGAIFGTPYCELHIVGKSTKPLGTHEFKMTTKASGGMICYSCGSPTPTHGAPGGKLMCQSCYETSMKTTLKTTLNWAVPLPSNYNSTMVKTWLTEMKKTVVGVEQLKLKGWHVEYNNPSCCATCVKIYKGVKAQIIKEKGAKPKVEHETHPGGPYDCPNCESHWDDVTGQVLCSHPDCKTSGILHQHCCCPHYHCTECDKHFDPESGDEGCASCEKCDDCGCSCMDDEGSGGGSENGTATLPPWEERGIKVEFPETVGIDTDWNEQWHIDPNEIDLAQLMADFYVLSCVAQGVANIPFLPMRAQDKDPWLKFLKDTAQRDLDELVNKYVTRLTNYVCMAVGGELRYHRAVKGASGSKGDRTAMWVKWRYIYDQVGPKCMADAGFLFRQMSGGSIGGVPWAVAAETAHAYLTRRISAFVWMDRMFTMQHNCGSLFNKIPWATKNSVKWNLDAMKRYIGPAHSANPPDWPVLLIVSSPEVQRKFNEMWRYGNRMKADWNMPRELLPTEGQGWNFRGAWGLHRITKGADGNNYEVVIEKHPRLGKKAIMKGGGTDMCEWKEWDSGYIIHFDKGGCPPGVSLVWNTGNGHKAVKWPDGSTKVFNSSTSPDSIWEHCYLPYYKAKNDPELHKFWSSTSYSDKMDLLKQFIAALKSGEIQWPDKKEWLKKQKKFVAEGIVESAKTSATWKATYNSNYVKEEVT